MLNKLLLVGVILSSAMGFARVSVAEMAEAEMGEVEKATIIVFRGEEPSRTSRIKFDVLLGSTSLGRLANEGVLVASHMPGEYVLDSSISGTKDIVIDLKPGQTYYVQTKMRLRGTDLRVSFAEVEEQVAKLQQPALDAAI